MTTSKAIKKIDFYYINIKSTNNNKNKINTNTDNKVYMDSFGEVKKEKKTKIVDNKITVRYIKDGKSKRTFITGLHHFLTPEEEIKLIKTFQKTLGAGVKAESEIKNKETDDDIENNEIENVDKKKPAKTEKLQYGFQGDHIEKIGKMFAELEKFKKEDVICIK